ncbi:hypothetical protein HDV05_001524 [Chytridiales sp. JEL 0842]|nr:hypothetical protein HDV05_001524 [Chytridiales sp. JEL 0842]
MERVVKFAINATPSLNLTGTKVSGRPSAPGLRPVKRPETFVPVRFNEGVALIANFTTLSTQELDPLEPSLQFNTQNFALLVRHPDSGEIKSIPADAVHLRDFRFRDLREATYRTRRGGRLVVKQPLGLKLNAVDHQIHFDKDYILFWPRRTAEEKDMRNLEQLMDFSVGALGVQVMEAVDGNSRVLHLKLKISVQREEQICQPQSPITALLGKMRRWTPRVPLSLFTTDTVRRWIVAPPPNIEDRLYDRYFPCDKYKWARSAGCKDTIFCQPLDSFLEDFNGERRASACAIDPGGLPMACIYGIDGRA